MLKALLFDKDGTLIGLDGLWVDGTIDLLHILAGDDVAGLEDLAAVVGIDLAHHCVIPFGLIAHGTCREVAEALAKSLSNTSAETIHAHLIALSDDNENHVVPLPGTVEVLIAVHRQGYQLGIISNDTVGGIEAAVHDLAIAPYISFIAGADSGYGSKPEPGMIHAFCAEHGIKAQQIAVIGDSIVDMQAARQSGCGLRIAIHPDSEEPTLSFYTPYILPDLRPLPALLARLHRGD